MPKTSAKRAPKGSQLDTRKVAVEAGDAEDDSATRLPRAEQAYQHIRQAIQEHRLKPGDRLREAELAEAVGVSRTPLREALARLESDGLIANDPARGLVVTRLDYNMVSELYYMREVLEGTAARLAAQHASDVELTILDQICEQYRRSIGDGAALEMRNRQFHEALYRCAHNRYLLRTLQGLHDALALLGESTLHDKARAESTQAEHEAIIRAIKERNPEAAEQATRAHIRNAQFERVKREFNRVR
jgi:DNA-binding GntR family transcriptional regulator